MPTLQIQLLGGFRLVYDQDMVTGVSQRRPQSLLAYLLLHRAAPQSRQHIAFLFWPDTTEAQARTNLRRELHALRRAIPDAGQFLAVNASTVQWLPEAPFSLDVVEFERLLIEAEGLAGATQPDRLPATLSRAIDLYQGELLPGHYDEWLLPERERLAQQFLGALERLLLLLEDQGDYAGAIGCGQRLLRQDPLHEPTYRRLMRLHALNGDRAGALRVYHTCATVLDHDLGVEPGPEIQAAYSRLLQMKRPRVLRERPAPPVVAAERLIGRRSAWETLRSVWEQAARGAARMVLISGEAGIGKTYLAEALLDSVGGEAVTTAKTRSYAAEGRLAYAPAIDWLRADGIYAALANLDDAWLSELARMLPELLATRHDLSPPGPLTERWQRQRLFEALARAILNTARPTLLLIDDLQWCDPETLEWLAYLLRFEPDARLLIAGTARAEEVDPDHPLTGLVISLRQNDQLTEIDLGPLNEADTTALAAYVTGHTFDETSTAHLFQETEGNPLFIVETLRVSRGEEGQRSRGANFSPAPLLPRPPAKILAVIQSRLAALSPSARNLAALAATVGRAFTVGVLRQAGDGDEDSLVRDLDELWGRRIIREQGVSAYDFSHDRIREAAYGEISPARRRQLHRQVAGALEQVYADDLDPVSAQLAAHYEQAGLVEQAVDYYLRAAQVSQDRLALVEAVTQGRAGLALVKTLPATEKRSKLELSMLLSLGSNLGKVEDNTSPEVERIYLQTRDISSHLKDWRGHYQALGELRYVYASRGNMRLAVEYGEKLLHLDRQLEDPALQANAHRANGLIYLQLGNFKQAQWHLDQALTLELKHDPAALSNAALTLWLLGYPGQSQNRIDEALALAEERSDPFALTAPLFFAMLLYVALKEGKQPWASARAAQLAAIGNKYDHLLNRLDSIFWQGWVLSETADLQAGIAQMRQGLDSFKKTGRMMFRTYRLGILVEAHLKAGQNEVGLAVLDEAFSASEQFEQRTWDAELHRLKGELLQVQGASDEEIETCYRQALAVAQTQGAKSLELRAAINLSRLWQGQGKQAEAYHLLSEIYNWFSEGFDTRDLQEAKALLEALSKD